MSNISRRKFLSFVASQGVLASSSAHAVPSIFSPPPNAEAVIRKVIPSSGKPLAVIGMGTWQTFNVGNDPKLRKARTRVLKTFFEFGGELVDSSPMYGSSQNVLGYGLQQLGHPSALFSADKVWTSDGTQTLSDMSESLVKWNLPRFDLVQVHNLVNWQAHLPKLFELKRRGKLNYVGVSTSHGRRHKELESLLLAQPLDFVQLTYNIDNRKAEQRLLAVAQERGIAVIANRPFAGGNLVDRLKQRNASLPDWARDIDCRNWPQFLLKFIVSHPAVTCAIPATSKVTHMKENMGALQGRLPDSKMREEMVRYVDSLKL